MDLAQWREFRRYNNSLQSTGVRSRGKKNRLKNRLRFCLRLNFDSMTCLNYLFLDFFQYRKSQADSQENSQAYFQAVFSPLDPTPDLWTYGTSRHIMQSKILPPHDVHVSSKSVFSPQMKSGIFRRRFSRLNIHHFHRSSIFKLFGLHAVFFIRDKVIFQLVFSLNFPLI